MTKIMANVLVESESVKSLLTDAQFSHLNTCEYFIFPGFCDVHVHFREPGFSYKETIKTGSLAAAKGGYKSDRSHVVL